MVATIDHALWVYHTAYKNPLGMSPYWLIYDKACHLLIELEHKAYWALKVINLDLTNACPLRKLHINELDELRCDAYQMPAFSRRRWSWFTISYFSSYLLSIGRDATYDLRLHLFLSKLIRGGYGCYRQDNIYTWPHS